MSSDKSGQGAAPQGIGRVLNITGQVLVVVFTIVAGIAALGIWINPRFDPFGWKDAGFEEVVPTHRDGSWIRPSDIRLVAFQSDDESAYVPYGPDLPTPVSFPNNSDSPCVIQEVEFVWKRQIKTPEREPRAGGMTPLIVNYTKPIKKGARVYRKKIRPPHKVEGNDWANIEVAMIDKKKVGFTYIGTLTVYYNNNKKISLERVELDILAKAPEPPEWQ
jgi:hypothetical protein